MRHGWENSELDFGSAGSASRGALPARAAPDAMSAANRMDGLLGTGRVNRCPKRLSRGGDSRGPAARFTTRPRPSLGRRTWSHSQREGLGIRDVLF